MIPSGDPSGEQSKILGFIYRFEDILLASLLGSMACLAITQVILRSVFDSGLVWVEPLLRILVMWVGMAGALLASRQDKHISIDVFSRLLSVRGKAIVSAITSLFTAGICGLIGYHATRMVQMDFESGIEAFSGFPVWVAGLVIPIAFSLIAFRYGLLFLTNARDAARGPSS